MVDQHEVHDSTDPTHLLDGNVLLALASESHVHHADARHWLITTSCPYATCPITQGSLLRLLMNLDKLALEPALAILNRLLDLPRHRFWPDSLGYPDIDWRGVIGHRQVTDAYLAALARHHRGKLATFDDGLLALHPDVAVGLRDG